MSALPTKGRSSNDGGYSSCPPWYPPTAIHLYVRRLFRAYRRHTRSWHCEAMGNTFTCLVTRAVYVDVAISLSANDFLLVLSRFVSVYRKPAHMFSDNGTNLTGAERILRMELKRLREDGVLAMERKALGIEWFFQSAQTPHFGSAHESLVRSVKNVTRSCGLSFSRCRDY
jgi:hypothetical protein